VKIRGFRIELGEIEGCLQKQAGIREAVVLAREDQPGEKRLVAYVVGEGGSPLDVSELREELSRRLPEYMVPAAYVQLERMPLTANGKLDRRALPAPEGEAFGRREYEEPQRGLERALAQIWSELLGVDRVGRQDHFFELGGHSLLATQVIARLRKAFDVQLAVHALFTTPTVAGLAEAVAESRRVASEADDVELARLLEELEGLSDEEAERLLAAELGKTETDQ
jgi:acyl carrier protein